MLRQGRGTRSSLKKSPSDHFCRSTRVLEIPPVKHNPPPTYLLQVGKIAELLNSICPAISLFHRLVLPQRSMHTPDRAFLFHRLHTKHEKATSSTQPPRCANLVEYSPTLALSSPLGRKSLHLRGEKPLK